MNCACGRRHWIRAGLAQWFSAHDRAAIDSGNVLRILPKGF